MVNSSKTFFCSVANVFVQVNPDAFYLHFHSSACNSFIFSHNYPLQILNKIAMHINYIQTSFEMVWLRREKKKNFKDYGWFLQKTKMSCTYTAFFCITEKKMLKLNFIQKAFDSLLRHSLNTTLATSGRSWIAQPQLDSRGWRASLRSLQGRGLILDPVWKRFSQAIKFNLWFEKPPKFTAVALW